MICENMTMIDIDRPEIYLTPAEFDWMWTVLVEDIDEMAIVTLRTFLGAVANEGRVNELARAVIGRFGEEDCPPIDVMVLSKQTMH